MKTGVFGGAFNPVHLGHLSIAKYYMKKLPLDRIIFIPTSIPPHKDGSAFASKDDRLNMLNLAVKNEKGFEISDMEFNREGKSYSYDTLAELKQLYPEDEFFLIIGADQFLSFDKWYKAEEIVKMVTICTAARNDGDEYNRLKSASKTAKIFEGAKVFIASYNAVVISSNDIREKILNGVSIGNEVPVGVEEYILEKGLYDV